MLIPYAGHLDPARPSLHCSAIKDTTGDLAHLEALRDQHLSDSLAGSSKATYIVGFNLYNKFCSQINRPTFPLAQSVLELFVTSLASIRVYLSSAQYVSQLKRYPEKVRKMARLSLVLRGIRRSQGSRRSRPIRLPITLQHLFTLHHYFLTHLNSFDTAMLRAATSVTFFFPLAECRIHLPSQLFLGPLHGCVLMVGGFLEFNHKVFQDRPIPIGTAINLSTWLAAVQHTAPYSFLATVCF